MISLLTFWSRNRRIGKKTSVCACASVHFSACVCECLYTNERTFGHCVHSVSKNIFRLGQFNDWNLVNDSEQLERAFSEHAHTHSAIESNFKEKVFAFFCESKFSLNFQFFLISLWFKWVRQKTRILQFINCFFPFSFAEVVVIFVVKRFERKKSLAKMVYESDFYTTRRPYSSRPNVSSYSVTVRAKTITHVFLFKPFFVLLYPNGFFSSKEIRPKCCGCWC